MMEKIAINTASIVIAIVVLLLLFRVFNLWNLLPGGSGIIGVFNQNPAALPGNNMDQRTPGQLEQFDYNQGNMMLAGGMVMA